MKQTGRNAKAGMALLLATCLMAIAALLLGTLALRVVTQKRHIDAYLLVENCFQGIESGVAQAKASVESGDTGAVGLGTWTPPSAGSLPSLGDSGVQPLQVQDMPGVRYIAYTQDWGTDGIDNNGDGTVDELNEQGYYTVYSFAQDETVIRQAEVVYAGTDVNVWRNAIFAGGGQVGGVINGNVSIHGSVHILGDNLASGGAAIEALDLSGTSLIHNNYVGIPAALAARVPALPTRVFGGETVSTLNAKLRVKHGRVGMDGNSEIGSASVTGNAVKETLDGTYVSDGWSGNSVNADGGRNDPTHVSSDNGYDVRYDLGNKVSLPLLTGAYRQPSDGHTIVNPATGLNYTHDQYFHSVLTGTPLAGTGSPATVTLDVNSSTVFYYNATRPTDTNPANRLSTDDYIYFTPASDRLYINGQIEINGNLVFEGHGGDTTINYSGRGALLVHGNVSIETNLLSVNANGTTANSFPQNNVLGIMASGNIDIGVSAQRSVMGAFYAQGVVGSDKQTNIMGTIVGTSFNMGSQVPSIFQVPTLADYLPEGMIGAYKISVLQQVSWRELGA